MVVFLLCRSSQPVRGPFLFAFGQDAVKLGLPREEGGGGSGRVAAPPTRLRRPFTAPGDAHRWKTPPRLNRKSALFRPSAFPNEGLCLLEERLGLRGSGPRRVLKDVREERLGGQGLGVSGALNAGARRRRAREKAPGRRAAGDRGRAPGRPPAPRRNSGRGLRRRQAQDGSGQVDLREIQRQRRPAGR